MRRTAADFGVFWGPFEAIFFGFLVFFFVVFWRKYYLVTAVCMLLLSGPSMYVVHSTSPPTCWILKHTKFLLHIFVDVVKHAL